MVVLEDCRLDRDRNGPDIIGQLVVLMDMVAIERYFTTTTRYTRLICSTVSIVCTIHRVHDRIDDDNCGKARFVSAVLIRYLMYNTLPRHVFVAC
jgi:hypothetical protein